MCGKAASPSSTPYTLHSTRKHKKDYEQSE